MPNVATSGHPEAYLPLYVSELKGNGNGYPDYAEDLQFNLGQPYIRMGSFSHLFRP